MSEPDTPPELDALLNRPTGSTLSERHPRLAALGGVSLILGVVASGLYLMVIWATPLGFNSWVWAPFAFGAAMFLGTALVAVVRDNRERGQ